jgi:hypothetical protein
MGAKATVFDGWPILERELPEDYRESAERIGLIHPVPPQLKAKITNGSDLLRLLLHHATGSSSLETTTAQAGATGLPSISAVALHKWECKAAPWLALLVGKMLRADGACADFEGDTVGGYRVVVTDGTSLSRPGAEGTTARIHYAMRLPGLELVRCEVTDVGGGETLRRFDVQPGELWIGDRAYGTPPSVTSVWAQDGAVLVRINRTNMPLFSATGARIDIDDELARIAKRDAPIERPAFVHGPQGEIIEGRLCILWLPHEQAAAARKRARREKRANGEKVTDSALRAAEYVIIFTTAEPARIPTELVFRVYRARWQVELQMKRSKSLGHIDCLPNFRDDTIATWLYANLLMQQIARRLAERDLASPPRPAKRTRPHGPSPRRSLTLAPTHGESCVSHSTSS